MAWLEGIRNVLLDNDGTLLLRDRAIPGAAEAMIQLRRRAIPFRLVSNTTRRSCAEVARLLCEQGIEIAPDEVILPAALARRRIVESGRSKAVLLVPPSTRDDFRGIDVVEQNPDWVVVGDIGSGFDWPTMNATFKLLMDGVSFLALHKNPHWRGDEEGFVIDAGAFVTALEFAAGVEAEVVGKPSARFYQMALNDLSARAGETLMIGDNLQTDICGAAEVGCKTGLVLTGNVKRGDALHPVSPDLILESIAELTP
jgi:HAD superfamily hydrolase (TIGR01458 family)